MGRAAARRLKSTVTEDSVNRSGPPPTYSRTNIISGPGLFIADIEHMPDNVCGSWPAFWTFHNQDTWPTNGEIDILEGVNNMNDNAVTLHTQFGCYVDPPAGTYRLDNPDCNADNARQGCSIHNSNDERNNYGRGFNAIRGGVYAMQWTDSGITVWFFPRDHIPSDIITENPNPGVWEERYKQSSHQGNCDFSKHFKEQRITFDIKFCGEWSGNRWEDTCRAQTGGQSCIGYVHNNPAAFKDVFWLINFVKVYER
jgi:hypothetical protein